ncbi:hypothetical protein [Tomitella fengzijianii]|uniref:Uncharacterized protein n=1 Tax=Tomitella fengzijianii TaxID=2597660 RepID=A0A516X6C7_9ACTN|nr:hypothetical protein [Tomitella fengzijianii]QDQ98563.1 hypothetical protein FO059_16090 [Tomitella fengzijianii]
MSARHPVSARRFLECVETALEPPARALDRVGIIHVSWVGTARDGGPSAPASLQPPEASVITRHMRDGDVLGRLGRREYAVLTIARPATIITRAAELASALLGRAGVTATVDVAITTGGYEPARLLIARARAATPPDDDAGPTTAPIPVAR